jgi:hypothetical protein
MGGKLEEGILILIMPRRADAGLREMSLLAADDADEASKGRTGDRLAGRIIKLAAIVAMTWQWPRYAVV